jgi:hypothetical protein
MKIKDFFQTFEIIPISTSPMHGPITPRLLQHLKKSNEKKLEKSIELLGDKWLLHPSNREQRKVPQ